MKEYRVIVTPDAEEDLRKYLLYLRKIKKNSQAVKNVLNDFKETKKELEKAAGSLANPESEELKRRGLKRINFIRHNYFMLYYIDKDENVYVTNIFHGLEDYESKLR